MGLLLAVMILLLVGGMLKHLLYKTLSLVDWETAKKQKAGKSPVIRLSSYQKIRA